jgi:cell division septum initiation protein DivIVA
VAFDYECFILPVDTDRPNLLFSQFNELEVKGYIKYLIPDYPQSLEEENKQLKDRIFELEQQLSKK